MRHHNGYWQKTCDTVSLYLLNHKQLSDAPIKIVYTEKTEEKEMKDRQIIIMFTEISNKTIQKPLRRYFPIAILKKRIKQPSALAINPDKNVLNNEVQITKKYENNSKLPLFII